MNTREINRSDKANDTPKVALRPDGKYLSYSPAGSLIMIGVYGETEEEAVILWQQRLNAWRESIETGLEALG